MRRAAEAPRSARACRRPRPARPRACRAAFPAHDWHHAGLASLPVHAAVHAAGPASPGRRVRPAAPARRSGCGAPGGTAWQAVQGAHGGANAGPPGQTPSHHAGTPCPGRLGDLGAVGAGGPSARQQCTKYLCICIPVIVSPLRRSLAHTSAACALHAPPCHAMPCRTGWPGSAGGTRRPPCWLQ